MNVLLCVFDCLRKDYWDNRMPNKDRITSGKGWAHFANHWAVAHCSDPNFSTILGGQPPWVTGITTQMGAGFISVSPFLLPLLFTRELGYYAWAIEPIKCPRFYHMFDEIAWQRTEQNSDLELRPIQKFVEQAGDRPWFGFIRDMTTHYPYNEQPCPPRGAGGEIIPQYEGAVDHLDQFVERVWAYLQEVAPDTLVIFAADHGELLGEHGEWDHLYTMYSYLTSVPLAIYVPGSQRKVRRTYNMTQHVDLYPTILDAVGLRVEAGSGNKGFPGISLWPWLTGKTKLLPKKRTFKFQGTGAGPSSEEMVAEAPTTSMIDPGSGRSLWRHRGVIHNGIKVIENIHLAGKHEFVVTRPHDYGETKRLRWGRKQITPYERLMPPIPDYTTWELSALARNQPEQITAAQEALENDEVVLQRLKDLGYA